MGVSRYLCCHSSWRFSIGLKKNHEPLDWEEWRVWWNSLQLIWEKMVQNLSLFHSSLHYVFFSTNCFMSFAQRDFWAKNEVSCLTSKLQSCLFDKLCIKEEIFISLYCKFCTFPLKSVRKSVMVWYFPFLINRVERKVSTFATHKVICHH